MKNWTKQQQEKAASIVNDIAEGIDNGESRKELRQALAVYADMLDEKVISQVTKDTRDLSKRIDRLFSKMREAD